MQHKSASHYRLAISRALVPRIPRDQPVAGVVERGVCQLAKLATVSRQLDCRCNSSSEGLNLISCYQEAVRAFRRLSSGSAIQRHSRCVCPIPHRPTGSVFATRSVTWHTAGIVAALDRAGRGESMGVALAASSPDANLYALNPLSSGLRTRLTKLQISDIGLDGSDPLDRMTETS